MKLQKILDVGVKLLSIKGQTPSITEAICRQFLFRTGVDPGDLALALQEAVGSEKCTSQLLDWFNAFLFNVCSFNEQLISHHQNNFLESTEDAPHFNGKTKMQASSLDAVAQIKSNLRKWLQRILTLPFVQRILAEGKQKNISKNKSLRSFLETVDYLAYKYQLTIAQREQLSTLLSSIDRRTQNAIMIERADWTNRRIFTGAVQLVNLLNEIADNYTINLSSLAAIIVANYFHSNPPRRPFQTANNSGEVIAEEIMDFLIRKCPKNDLFSQKMDSYRPFQLFMQIIFQKFGSTLLRFNELLLPLLANSSSFYHPENYRKIQAMASLLSYELENNYPRLQHLLSYTHSSLLAKYTTAESMELMKKLLLNRFLLNPFYFALLHSPSEQQMERYVRLANEARILFYQKKVEAIGELKSTRLVELAALLRNSLNSLVSHKENQSMDSQARCDKGIYINDTLLGVLYGEISDNLKNAKRSKPSNSELHSQSSLSFSLRNDSASRMQPTHQHLPSHHHLPISSNNSSLPQLPKPPSNPREDSSQRNTSKIVVSTNVHLEEPPVERLQQLIMLRRDYGEQKQQRQMRSTERQNSRNNWKRQLALLNNPIAAVINDLSKSSSQLMIHSLLL